MSEPGYESVELRLVEAGSEFLPTIEAAQYARVIDHDEPSTPAEAGSIESFLDAFADAAEAWEGLGAGERAVRLANLGDRLEALEAVGLHVHVGTLQRRFAVAGRGAPALPMAVLTVGRSDLPTRQVLLPAELAVDQRGPPLH